jgi:hypothetical protein
MPTPDIEPFKEYLKEMYGIKDAYIETRENASVLVVRLPEDSSPYIYGELGVITYRPETGYIDDRFRDREFYKDLSSSLIPYLSYVFGTYDFLYTFEALSNANIKMVVYADVAYPRATAEVVKKWLSDRSLKADVEVKERT